MADTLESAGVWPSWLLPTRDSGLRMSSLVTWNVESDMMSGRCDFDYVCRKIDEQVYVASVKREDVV